MTNENDKLVVAYYTNEAAAHAAADDLKDWDDANDEIKLGAIGIITLNRDNGEVEVKEIGQRTTKKGALWGTAIGATAGILSAGIALIPGMIAGAAIGGGVGALNHKSLGMTDQDVQELAEHLKHGGAALGVMCDDFEVAATKARMVQEGGKIGQYDLADDASKHVTLLAEAQKSASDAVEEAAAETADAATDIAGAIAAATGLAYVDAGRLNKAGVAKVSDLLEQGATPQGRAELATATGLDEETVLLAVKRLDLMRINGVNVVYSALLHKAGVETVPDLARRNATNLTNKLPEVNETVNIADKLPSEVMVVGWIDQAKDLPRVIEY
jgi:uncharacterized membrane protein